MVILKFLLILFIIFYAIMLLGRLFLKRMVKRAQQQYNGNRQQGQQKNRRKEGETYVQYKPQEKKHIPNDEGDYIDYEEIK